jgi:hypothetical protein
MLGNVDSVLKLLWLKYILELLNVVFWYVY